MAALGAAAAFGLAPRASAAGVDWLTPAAGNWTDAANWSSAPYFPNNGVPGAGTTCQAMIGATGAPYTVTLDASGVAGGTITVDRLTVGSDAAFVVAAGGTLRAATGLVISAGGFRLNGGTLKDTVVPGVDGSFFPSIGTLDNVTFTGNVVAGDGFPTYGTPLVIRNCVTLNGTDWAIRPNVSFQGNQTLSI